MSAATATRLLEVTSYPPPRAGWGVRVEFLKRRLERDGHTCVVLNIGTSRAIPSDEYETVMGGRDFVEKVWRFSREGFTVHAHANGDAIKGTLLALLAMFMNLAFGRRPFLTFHAGAIQRYFPRHKAWHLAPLYWLLFQLPRTVICNSDAVKNHIAGYGVSRRKIVAIPAFCREYLEFESKPLPRKLDAFLERYPAAIFAYIRVRPLFFPLTLIDGFAEIAMARGDAGLVLCGMAGHVEPGLVDEFHARIRSYNLEDRICALDDLDHDEFLTALQRSALYLRTPITDGVASSVLEAMALGVPVVACENGTRPAGVICYPAEDAGALAAACLHVLDNRDAVVGRMDQVELRDTLTEELTVLTS